MSVEKQLDEPRADNPRQFAKNEQAKTIGLACAGCEPEMARC